ncbi:hypothetical protein OIO90_002492 [Microbotryomycetes sp. JL221]|nr:hypothetical protein OIO90_002492 [Microbotryomycetes sp. JL221]
MFAPRAAANVDDDDNQDVEDSATRSGYASSNDEDAWDEIDVTADHSAEALARAQQVIRESDAGHASNKGLSITIASASKGKGKRARTDSEIPFDSKKSDGTALQERMVRQQRHRAHAAALLAVGLVRNRFINDKMLQARLLSKVPLSIQNAFFTFSRQTHESLADRSRLFESALKNLLDWWFRNFQVLDEKELVRRDIEEVAQDLAAWNQASAAQDDSRFPWDFIHDGNETSKSATSSTMAANRKQKSSKGKAKLEWGSNQECWEPINGVSGMSKHAMTMRGSRDMSAQLFTCLCRALDIPARLVFSMQPLDWRSPSAIRASSGNRSTASKFNADTDDHSVRKLGGKSAAGSASEDSAETWRHPDTALTYRKPKVNLRKSKVATSKKPRGVTPDVVDPGRPPVFWTEVYSRTNKVWFPIDAVRKRYRREQCKMEPPRSSRDNQLMYVVAIEEDRYMRLTSTSADESVRDVTPRYAKSFTNVTAKARAPSRKNTDWFEAMLMPFHRSFQLSRDRAEEKELWDAKHNEPFPSSIGGFKNHPNYVLEQHLLRDEAIVPGSKPLGLFKGTEPVYSRSSVVNVKSEENYWRIGRVVKDNEIPFKWAKARTVTINKKRAEALAQMDGEEAQQQALYSFDQTVLYTPPPVRDGKVPRNKFGNIDLYVPSMLPIGAVHLTSKHAAKCAKALNIDYAEAITGFEFRQRRANPVITGIVVASEQAELLLDAIAEAEQASEEREFAKRQERCLKRWKKLILALRIRQRVHATYRESGPSSPASGLTDRSELTAPARAKKRVKSRSPSSEGSVSIVSPPRKRKAAVKQIMQTQHAGTAPPVPEVDDGDVPKRSLSGFTIKIRAPQAVTLHANTELANSASATPPQTENETEDDFEYESD